MVRLDPMRAVSTEDLGWPGKGVFMLEGELPPSPRLAIVGARAAERRFASAVAEIVQVSGSLGWSIVSGGALGIDAEAHRQALHRSVPQLAVLPCGPDRPYPPDHVTLFGDIVRHGGALLFAHGPGNRPTRAMFASRNRWIVLAAEAIVVVQASLRSGSILTGRLGAAQGRRVAAIPGTSGCSELIAGGATPLAWDPHEPERFRDLVTRWMSGTTERSSAACPDHLRAIETVLKQRGPRGACVSDFVDPLEACIHLVDAEERGLVHEVSPGRYVWGGE